MDTQNQETPGHLAGDAIKSEHDGCKYCLGCPVCEEELFSAPAA
jgi:hypothetical protein